MKIHSELISMKVRVHGKPVQEYNKDGNAFVEGRRGTAYTLLIENLTGRRILVHPAIDGLSVMTGKPASKNDSSDGYILDAHKSIEIPGWRLDDGSVAKFRFGNRADAYAEQVGEGGSQGVIACPVWKEKPLFEWLMTIQSAKKAEEDHHHYHHYYYGPFVYTSFPHPQPQWGQTVITCNNVSIGSSTQKSVSPPNLMAGSACEVSDRPTRSPRKGILRSAQTCNNLGTEFGEQAKHEVHSVSFTPATKEPCGVAIIYYDDKAGLELRGIRLDKNWKSRQSSALPEPFRGSGCRPPDGWRG